MPPLTLLDQFLAVLAGGLLAATVLFASSVWFNHGRRSARELMSECGSDVAFLFDGEDLVDASEKARDLLTVANGSGSDWSRVAKLLKTRFPSLPGTLEELLQASEERFPAGDSPEDGVLLVTVWDGLVRLRMESAAPTSSSGHDAITLAAMQDELDTLRTLAEDSPQLIWRLDGDGQITWANRSYLDVAFTHDTRANDGLPVWPPIQLFDKITGAPPHGEASRRRVSVADASGEHLDWYEVTSQRRGTGSVHFATESNGLVRAEQAQRDFVQTLTRTFADLQIALVVFDKHRRLVLFNPAFLDLSGLDVSFLSSRPVIQSVLDRLRDARILPEPKDYASWRDQMAELETAAQDGTYCETWTLPGTQTLRVTGRPHPNGAIAFLFEDITSEVSLARRFRSELEFGQAVIDNISEAVSVFSAQGTQVAINRHYCELWDVPPEAEALGEVSFGEALAHWRKHTVPTPVWGDLQDFFAQPDQRAEWTDTVQMEDGRAVGCRFTPLSAGAVMVSFIQVDPVRGTTKDSSIDPEVALLHLRG